MAELDFIRHFLAKICGKCAQKRTKTGFFEFIEKFGHLFFVTLTVDESLNNLLCCCTKIVSGKNLDPEIWVKMLLANQIAEF